MHWYHFMATLHLTQGCGKEVFFHFLLPFQISFGNSWKQDFLTVWHSCCSIRLAYRKQLGRRNGYNTDIGLLYSTGIGTLYQQVHTCKYSYLYSVWRKWYWCIPSRDMKNIFWNTLSQVCDIFQCWCDRNSSSQDTEMTCLSVKCLYSATEKWTGDWKRNSILRQTHLCNPP